MKKTNIAFSGFMAAILFSASASAATTQIASKTYVDNQKETVLQTVEENYAKTETVNQIQQDVTNLGDTINNAETGLAKQVSDNTEAVGQLQSSVGTLETTVGNKGAGLVKDVTDLKTAVGGKLDSSAAATTYEALANKSQNLNTDGTSPDKYPLSEAAPCQSAPGYPPGPHGYQKYCTWESGGSIPPPAPPRSEVWDPPALPPARTQPGWHHKPPGPPHGRNRCSHPRQYNSHCLYTDESQMYTLFLKILSVPSTHRKAPIIPSTIGAA